MLLNQKTKFFGCICQNRLLSGTGCVQYIPGWFVWFHKFRNKANNLTPIIYSTSVHFIPTCLLLIFLTHSSLENQIKDFEFYSTNKPLSTICWLNKQSSFTFRYTSTMLLYNWTINFQVNCSYTDVNNQTRTAKLNYILKFKFNAMRAGILFTEAISELI